VRFGIVFFTHGGVEAHSGCSRETLGPCSRRPSPLNPIPGSAGCRCHLKFSPGGQTAQSRIAKRLNLKGQTQPKTLKNLSQIEPSPKPPKTTKKTRPSPFVRNGRSVGRAVGHPQISTARPVSARDSREQKKQTQKTSCC